MSPSAETNYFLWKVTKSSWNALRHNPRSSESMGWARSDEKKTEVFAAHFSKVFEPIHMKSPWRSRTDCFRMSEYSCQNGGFCKAFHRQRSASCNQSSECQVDARLWSIDNNQVLRKLSEKAIRFITQLYNAAYRQDFFSPRWKIAQIIMIQKLSKLAELAESYRPISLLPVLSKLFKKLLLPRLSIRMERQKMIFNHFGLQHKHATIEQIHRIIKRISANMNAGWFCTTFSLSHRHFTTYSM